MTIINAALENILLAFYAVTQYSKRAGGFLIGLAALVLFAYGGAANAGEGSQLLYSNPLATDKHIADWTMEGPGKTSFADGWMTMYSPQQAGHHVLWCPTDFPDNFVAEWEVQNLDTEAGLVIVFFAAAGLSGEDIFAPSLKPRDGTFDQYTLGDIRSYHISYYANAAHNKDRGHANLRKNNTFTLLQKGEEGIATRSLAIHKVRLQKIGPHIRMWIDGREVINHKDQQVNVWGKGKIGFRQMQWTRFRYRNFKVWSVKKPANRP